VKREELKFNQALVTSVAPQWPCTCMWWSKNVHTSATHTMSH